MLHKAKNPPARYVLQRLGGDSLVSSSLLLLGIRGLETIAYRWKAKRVQLLLRVARLRISTRILACRELPSS